MFASPSTFPRPAPEYEEGRPVPYLVDTLWTMLSDLHLVLAWEWERLMLTIYSLYSFVLLKRRRDRAVSSRDTALVIMNAGEGNGRILALKLAEAGYTIFACVSHDVPSPRGPATSSASTFSSKLAPLLFSWQRRKAETDSHSWLGTIVPLIFDTSSSEERERARETIHAYCEQHSLRLGGLIVPPPILDHFDDGYSPSGEDTNFGLQGSMSPETTYRSGSRSPNKKRRLSVSSLKSRSRSRRSSQASNPGIRLRLSDGLETDQWILEEAEFYAVQQPSDMVQTLQFVLAGSRACVVFLDGERRDSNHIARILDSKRRALSRTLHIELGAMNIHVAHIETPPLRQAPVRFPSIPSLILTPLKLVPLISDLFAIDEDTYCALVQSVLMARYPRAIYPFGLMANLRTYLPLPKWVWHAIGAY